MNILELISKPLEDLKQRKDIDINLTTDGAKWNVLFICHDVKKIEFFLNEGVNINHISENGNTALFHCKEVDKFKMIAEKIRPDLLYHLNKKGEHFANKISKDSFDFLLNETKFDLGFVLQNVDKPHYKNILKSILGSQQEDVHNIIRERLRGQEIPFSFLNEKGFEKLYVNEIDNVDMVKLCFECTPKLYNIFDDKHFEDREKYLKLIDSQAFHFVDDFKVMFGEVKAKKEKNILLNSALSEKEFLNEKKRRI